jgi:hypothetical protein
MCLQATKVDVADVERVYKLFLDEKRSVEFLKQYQEEFMFSEQEGKQDLIGPHHSMARTHQPADHAILMDTS